MDGMNDNIGFTFSIEPEHAKGLRDLLVSSPETFDLTLDGTVIGTNGRRFEDLIEFEYTPEALELLQASRSSIRQSSTGIE